MFKALRNKALKVNLKKGFIVLLIACAVFAVGSGIALYLNFGDRAAQVKEAREQKWEQMMADYSSDASGDCVGSGCYTHGSGHGISGKDISLRRWDMMRSGLYPESEWALSTGDKAMVGVVSGIAAVLVVIYWLLCMIWAYQLSNRLGSNSALWVIAVLFLNLWAIAGLYIYAGFVGKCRKCGHLKQKGEKYCSHCGNAYEIRCESCRETVSADAFYCPNCGRALNNASADN